MESSHMKKNTPCLAMLLISALALSGCVANKEMTQVIDHLQQSNKHAQEVIEQLSVKDKAMTDLVNDRNSQIKQLMTAQVKQQYFSSLASLRLAIIEVNAEIDKAFENTKQACLKAVTNESKNLSTLVSEAEQQAAALHSESLKFPNDKVLELQVAKAAADYFGRLNSLNTIEGKAKGECNEKLSMEKDNARKRVDEFQSTQTANLAQVKARKVSEISTTKFIVINHSNEHFDALLAWTRENETAHNNTMMYLQTNNILSPEGVLASAIKSFGKGAIAVVIGKDVVAPSATDIVNSGTALIEGLTKPSKEEFDSRLLEAKQGLVKIKGDISTKLKDIVQSSVLTVLRIKADK